MPEFLTLLPPDEAKNKWLTALNLDAMRKAEVVDTTQALGRVAAEEIVSPHPLPDFPRSTVDGFAVIASDTHGASDALPAYLTLIGEVPMGGSADFSLKPGQTAVIHTGGMLPEGVDAVVMLEYTQTARAGEIEIQRAVAAGDNLVAVGEDVARGQIILEKGIMIRPADVGGLMAMGITSLRVAKKIRVGIISSGDEVVDPENDLVPGQVRDINSYTLAALVERSGGIAVRYGIVGDSFEELQGMAKRALVETDLVVITAGSSASTRDMTAAVIDAVGEPGVLVHGINTRPGKPTILGVCAEKPVIGLPGNPVSALVNGYMLLVPVMEAMLGKLPTPKPIVQARLSVNLASQAGREDWWPVKLRQVAGSHPRFVAEPIFGKSNLIFTLARADGLLKIIPDATGLSTGEVVEVYLI